MSPGSDDDSPATLYGPVAAALGLLACVTLALGRYTGASLPMLTGSLAITFAVLGLRQGFRRRLCLLGLTTGVVGVGLPLALIAAYALGV
ncbi:hypothetical protein ACFVIM_22875 [Streptomyces sp. NPDC057638]|uniref:hypothetical protein n=1 Tax=Streptomyces sp. NPDC057638 TaxID=3346190 RepID=UPI00367D1C95